MSACRDRNVLWKNEWMNESTNERMNVLFYFRVIKNRLKASLVLDMRELKEEDNGKTKTKSWAVQSPWRQSGWNPSFSGQSVIKFGQKLEYRRPSSSIDDARQQYTEQKTTEKSYTFILLCIYCVTFTPIYCDYL